MTIVFNTIANLEDQRLRLEIEYCKELCNFLSHSHEVILLYKNPYFHIEGIVKEHKNITAIELPPRTKHPVKFYFWFSGYLKKLLKEKSVSMLISTGIPLARISIPYVILGSQHLNESKVAGFSNSLLRKSLIRAKKVFVFSETKKESFLRETEVITPGKFEAVPLDFSEREKIKEQVAGESEYFLYYGYLENVPSTVNLLKAFSSFKKRQRSSMKLVIIGKKRNDFAALQKLLNTFRFKADVVLCDEDSIANLKEIFAAGYALIAGPESQTHFSALILAMQMNTPVIAPQDYWFTNLVVDSVLTYNPSTFEDLGLKLIKIFQDEKERTELIELGAARTQSFNWNGILNLLHRG